MRSNISVDNTNVGVHAKNVIETGSTSHQEVQNENGVDSINNGNNNQRVTKVNPNLAIL